MPANTVPIYPITPKVNWNSAAITAANTAKDGSGTVATIFTAGANGDRPEQIIVRPLGTNVATVMRFFINNGLTNATPANNSLIHEITCPATTLSEVAALAGIDVLISKGLDVVVPIPPLSAGYKVNVTIGTAVAAGFAVTASGGDY